MLLQWHQQVLAKRSKVARRTIQSLEKLTGEVDCLDSTYRKLTGTLAAAGIEFLSTDANIGVKISRAQTETAPSPDS